MPTFLGLAWAFWGFVIAFVVATFTLPVLVYVVIPLTGGSSNIIGHLLAIVAALATDGTMFELADDGRYRPRPMRVDREAKTIEYWARGEWHEVKGPMERLFRLGFRDAAFTYEKNEDALDQFLVDPSDLEDEGRTIEEVTGVALDGGDEPADVRLLDDVRADRFRAVNPFPGGADDVDDEYIIDMDVVHQRMEGSAETNLLEKALERALVEAAHTSRLEQIALYAGVFMAMGGGAAIAWLTTA